MVTTDKAISFDVKGRFPSSATPPGNDVFVILFHKKGIQLKLNTFTPC